MKSLLLILLLVFFANGCDDAHSEKHNDKFDRKVNDEKTDIELPKNKSIADMVSSDDEWGPTAVSNSPYIGLSENELLEKLNIDKLGREGNGNKKSYISSYGNIPPLGGHMYNLHQIFTFQNDVVVKHERARRKGACVIVRPIGYE